MAFISDKSKLEFKISTENCDLFSDGSLLLKFGGYSDGEHFIPFKSKEEADEFAIKLQSNID